MEGIDGGGVECLEIAADVNVSWLYTGVGSPEFRIAIPPEARLRERQQVTWRRDLLVRGSGLLSEPTARAVPIAIGSRG